MNNEWSERWRGEDVSRADLTKENGTGSAGRWRRPSVTTLAAVRPEKVTWLWPGRIPRGAVSLLDGDPGLGKSSIALDLAARVSTGRPMPDGTLGVSASDVVIVSYEDHLAATIRPRLDAAVADVSRIHALAVDTEHGIDAPTLPEDLCILTETIERAQAALAIVDPLMAALGGQVDSHRDQDVRRVLAPLARMAEELDVAVLCVRHLRKAAAGSPIYAGGGSIGIVGASRSALLVGACPDEPEHHRVLARSKCNLAAPVPSLRYRLAPCGSSVAVEWCGEVEHSAGDLLAAAAERGRGESERPLQDLAGEVLRSELAGGPRKVKDVRRAAADAGVSDRTLRRAAERLRLEPRPTGGPGSPWEYPSLASLAMTPKHTDDGQTAETAEFGHESQSGQSGHDEPPSEPGQTGAAREHDFFGEALL